MASAKVFAQFCDLIGAPPPPVGQKPHGGSAKARATGGVQAAFCQRAADVP